jgi:hypothetical protein
MQRVQPNLLSRTSPCNGGAVVRAAAGSLRSTLHADDPLIASQGLCFQSFAQLVEGCGWFVRGLLVPYCLRIARSPVVSGAARRSWPFFRTPLRLVSVLAPYLNPPQQPAVPSLCATFGSSVQSPAALSRVGRACSLFPASIRLSRFGLSGGLTSVPAGPFGLTAVSSLRRTSTSIVPRS